MGNFLAATGRARPTRTMLDVLQGKLAIERGDRRERLVNNELMESNERLEQSRRINQQEEEKIAQGNKYHSLSTLDGQIYGGLKSPQGKRLVKIARGMGLLNYDIAPEGAIRQKDFSRVHQELLRPVTAKALANDVVEYERSNLNALQSELSEITTQLSEKDNPKLRERQQQLLTQFLPEQSIKYNASLDNLEGVSGVLDREIAAAKAAKTDSDDSKAITWMLPDKKIVRSFDGGRTYISDSGEPAVMPPGAFKFSGQYTGADIALLQEQQNVDTTQTTQAEQPTLAADAATEGTGVWANVAAAIDSVAGGLGIDKLFGKDGFFKDTQDARQQLRLIKQLGKSAFMNSSRGAIWEQQKIDKMFPNPDTFFTNPRTESRKFKTIRKALLIEKGFNNRAMKSSRNPKEILRLKESNADIDRLLSHIGVNAAMTFSQVMTELRKADAAGDTEKAASLAKKAQELRKLKR